MRHFLIDRLLFLVCIAISARTTEEKCPTHSDSSDPSGVNERIKQLEGQKAYPARDDKDEYDYEIRICSENDVQAAAVTQTKRKAGGGGPWTVGRFKDAQLQGGNDWLMATYLGGDKYRTHCGGAARKAVVMITCDPDATRGTAKVMEEFKTNENASTNEPCYYLFELNNKAACTVKPRHISPGSVLLIIFLIVGSVYLFLGFLYQRFIVGAKGLEQIPNYNLWRGCGSLQADGCNYFCRCDVAQPTRYKTMDDALADDEERDDRLLPM